MENSKYKTNEFLSYFRFLEKRTRQIMSSIFGAVQHLHSLRVVHRDLKPEK